MDASVPAPETAATPGRPDVADLPGIPLIDLAEAGPVALIEAERARAEALCAGARRLEVQGFEADGPATAVLRL